MEKHAAATVFRTTKRKPMARSWNLSAPGNAMSAASVTGVEVLWAGEKRRHVFPTMFSNSGIDRSSSVVQHVLAAALGGVPNLAGDGPDKPLSISVTGEVRLKDPIAQNSASTQDRGAEADYRSNFRLSKPVGSDQFAVTTTEKGRQTLADFALGLELESIQKRMRVSRSTSRHVITAEDSNRRNSERHLAAEPCLALDAGTTEARSSHDTVKVMD